MSKFIRTCIVSAAALAGPLTMLPLPAAATELPEAIAVSGEVLVATVQAAGTQIYECKADAAGKLIWQFREPVATLFSGGKTVGRHYAGPHWEMGDGSVVGARVKGRAPGASEDDIPLLRLEVTSWRGTGQLAQVSTIQRINTQGGAAAGACETLGALQNVPYAADYAFFRKADASHGNAAAPAPRPAAAAVRRAPAPIAIPMQAPTVSVIVLPREFPHRRKKKRDHDGEPKSPPKSSPSGEPKSPPTAEPKSPTPSGPKTTDNKTPTENVRDHRKNPPPIVRDHRGAERERPAPRKPASGPIVRDHRGVDTERSKPRESSARPIVRDHRGARTGSAGGGSSLCGASGMPPCRMQ